MSRNAPIHVPPTRLDRRLAELCYQVATPEIEPIMRVVTWLADEKLLMAGAVVVWLSLRSTSHDRTLIRSGDQMMCSLAIAGVLPHIFKHVFARERPDRRRVGRYRKGIEKSGNAWDSFPSGHAMHVGALAVAAGRMAPDQRPLIWSVAVGLAATRLLLLAHYLSDVIAGFLTGIAIDRIIVAVFRIATRHRWIAFTPLAAAPTSPNRS